jgi:hypothetical protein
MVIFQTLSFLLIAMLLMAMFAKARPWFKARVAGRVIQTVPMNIWQRINIHRSSLLALATAVVFGKAAGWLPDMLAVMITGFTLMLLLIPMKYTFTTQGVAIGDAIFRPWSEFTGMKVQSRQVVLENPSAFGRLTLFVAPKVVEDLLQKVSLKFES